MKILSKTTRLAIFLIFFLLATGFVFYPYFRQTRDELIRQVEENKNLTNQINELNQEIKRLEFADWKTYTNEEYGFELDVPVIGWEFKQESRGASVCRISDKKEEEERFCIGIVLEFLKTECSNASWHEIFASGEFTAGKGECITGRSYGGDYQKEIQTTSGARGYKGEIIFPLRENCMKESIVFFLVRKKVEINKFFYFPLVSLSYFNCPAYIDFGDEEIEVFDKVISSFRFIEK